MVLKKYTFPIVTVAFMAALYAFNSEIGSKAAGIASSTFIEMLSILPPVFIFLGLLDVWVPRETMVKYLGDHSGITGVIISFMMGSATAGPLYGAFPVAALLMRKGAKFSNVLIFVGAWSTTKIPMFMFEYAALGSKFALTRLAVDVVGILLIANIIGKIVSKEKIAIIYKNAENL